MGRERNWEEEGDRGGRERRGEGDWEEREGERGWKRDRKIVIDI